MKPWQRLGLVGGVGGVVAAGAAAGVAAVRRPGASRDPVDAPAGLVSPDRTTTVAADDGVPLVVEERGSTDAPMTVVLVHGFCLSQESWVLQRSHLAARADLRVVSYDHRGHGRSGSSPAAACTIDQLARDLQAVLRTVVPTGPVVLVGHSMGGMTVMALARQRPDLLAERVVGVALVATAAGAVGAPRLGLSTRNPLVEGALRVAALRPDLLQRGRAPVDRLVRPVIKAMSYGDRHTDPGIVAFSERILTATPVQTVVDFLPTLLDHDELAALPALAGRPVAVVCGDADRMTPFRLTAAIAAALPSAELVRVPGAGHLVQLERPETVTDAVLHVVDRALARRERLAREAGGARGA
ncbi:alpha/beta hydrolase [Rhodococcus aerolatus]